MVKGSVSHLFALLIVLFMLAACSGQEKPASISELKSARSRETAPDIAPATNDELVEGNNRFAFDLFRTTARDKGNLFFSPYSISAALAMTYAGAKSETAVQMADTLHYTLPQSQLHPAFNALNLRLMASDDEEEFALVIANAIWCQEDREFRQEFLDLLATHYGAGMYLVNFQNDAGRRIAGEWINRWVDDMTSGRISDLVDPLLFTDLTRLILTNVITFNGSWEDPFDDTESASFTHLDGSVIEVPLMRRHAVTPYASGEGWQAAELAYAGGGVHMLILLPAEGRYEQFTGELDAARLAEIEAALAPTDLLFHLPRFKYATSMKLADTLVKMGMPLPFSDSKADFSGMAEGPPPLYISGVFHKAFVAVDEAGTKAAAATAVEVEVGEEPSVPEVLRVDRPFLFLIRDMEHGAILFIGSVVDPEAS